MGKPIVYIAGPYRGDIKANIHAAKIAAMELAKRGIFYFCPHLNSARFDGIAPDEYFLEMGLEFVDRCDLVWVLPGWSKSAGSTKEIRNAMAASKPIYWAMDTIEKAIDEISE